MADTLLLMLLSFLGGMLLLKVMQKREEIDDEQSPDEGGKRTRIRRSDQIKVWRRDRGKCPECDADLMLARIKPLAEGGSNTPKNIRVTCPACGWGKPKE
ncbi:MAG: hypothetical protein AABY65_14030 [Nitrospirota bacterium]